MSEQIVFFEKNKADFSNVDVTATATEASDLALYVLNRSNFTGWMTTDSVDANNTELEINLNDFKSVTDLILLKHNFKAFTIQWWDGLAWNNFTPAINETNNTSDNNYYEFSSVLASKFKVTITGTQVANDDKYLAQFIVTEKIGQLAGWPVIKNALHSRNKVLSKTLSGKQHVAENVGAFAIDLSVVEWKSDADLTLVETLYSKNEGFLVWLCGGDETQFSSIRQGYRFEDLYLMKTTNDYAPNWVAGMYKRGLKIDIKLSEVIG